MHTEEEAAAPAAALADPGIFWQFLENAPAHVAYAHVAFSKTDLYEIPIDHERLWNDP